MTLDVTAITNIGHPAGDVAAYAMDPANDTTWIGGIKEVRVLTEPPLGIGSRAERVASFAGWQALFSPLMAMMVKHNISGDLRRLKEIMESRSAGSAA